MTEDDVVRHILRLDYFRGEQRWRVSEQTASWQLGEQGLVEEAEAITPRPQEPDSSKPFENPAHLLAVVCS